MYFCVLICFRLSDEWVSDKDVQSVKRISISLLTSRSSCYSLSNSDISNGTLSGILPQRLHRLGRRKQKCISSVSKADIANCKITKVSTNELSTCR